MTVGLARFPFKNIRGERPLITIVTRADSRTAVLDYLYSRGRSLRGLLKTIAYESLFGKRRLKTRAVIFADLERLDAAALHRAAGIKARLDEAGVPTLNDPARSMRRYQLLRFLHDAGINPFNVYSAAEPRPAVRFPVFLREAGEHSGAASKLFNTREELNAALARMEEIGLRRDTHLIVEYQDTRSTEGYFRKYGAFRIGDRIVPRHLLFSPDWEIKNGGRGFTPAQAKEEWNYVRDNPHAEALMKTFDMAAIEYGRIDYSFQGGRPVIWEINTNPLLGTAAIAAPELRGRQQQCFLSNITEAFQDFGDRPATAAKIAGDHRLIEIPLLIKKWAICRFPRARPALTRLGKRWRPLLERLGLPEIDRSKKL